MPRIKSLINIKLIGDILVTVAICDQRGATRIIGQARRPSAHGNVLSQINKSIGHFEKRG